MQLEVSHNSLEFANVQVILNTALAQPVFVKTLRRLPTFRPPKLIFIVDYYEFTKQYEVSSFLSGQNKQMRDALLAPEMYFRATSNAQRILIYTGLPSSYQPSPDVGIEVDAANVFLLYDAEIVLNYPNQAISEVSKSDIELNYQNVVRSSRFHAQDLAVKMRELSEYAIDIENKIFKEYRQLLENLQFRTQFLMNMLQGSYLGFKRQGERAEAVLKNLDQFDTVYALADSQMAVSRRFVAEYKFSYKYDVYKPSEPAQQAQNDYLIQFFNEKRADFLPNFKLYLNTSVDFNYPPNAERMYMQYSKARLAQDFENWLLEKGRVNTDFYRFQSTTGVRTDLKLTSEPVDEMHNVYLEAIRQTYRYEVLGELQGYLAASFTTVYRYQPLLVQQTDSYQIAMADKPMELSQVDEDAPDVDYLKDYSGLQSPAKARLIPHYRNELTTQTTYKPSSLLQTKLDKFSIATKAQAVKKIMTDFQMPSLDDFYVQEYQDVFLLMCYHFAKLRQSKSITNISITRRKNFNAENLCVVLELGDELTFLLVAGLNGYSPKAVLYQKGAFYELGDCKVSVGSVEAVGFSLKGKILSLGGEVTGFEKGFAYDICATL